MTTSHIIPIDEPREFHPQELFFSLTDDKGHIGFGNSIFTRISGYEETELIGRPHNVIRHPDMPRGVFHLFWEYLQSGRSIGAYVKNMAKDGRHYWVFAVAVPCPGGYLSVRLKPLSKLFEEARSLYTETLAMEQKIERQSGKKEAAEASHTYLVEKLQEKGFSSYDEFMIAALSQELTSRGELISNIDADAATHHAFSDAEHLNALRQSSHKTSGLLNRVFASLDVFRQLSKELPAKQENMAELGPTLTFLALNTHLSASRMGEDGATLSVISRAIRSLSKDADRLIESLMERMQSLCHSAESLEFNVAVASLESQVCAGFAVELIELGNTQVSSDVSQSLTTIVDELSQRSRSMFKSLHELLAQTRTLANDAQDLSRHVSQMRVAQLNGRIEIAAFSGENSFKTIFGEISSVVDDALVGCDEILALLSNTETQIEGLAHLESTLENDLDGAELATQKISGRPPVARKETEKSVEAAVC